MLECFEPPTYAVDTVLTDLPNQRVVRFDTKRTRGMIFDKEIHETLELFLTYYAKYERISYKQGLNELSAPFILLLKSGLSANRIFQYFSSFINRIIPNIYSDDVYILIFILGFLNSLKLLHHLQVVAQIPWHSTSQISGTKRVYSWIIHNTLAYNIICEVIKMWISST